MTEDIVETVSCHTSSTEPSRRHVLDTRLPGPEFWTSTEFEPGTKNDNTNELNKFSHLHYHFAVPVQLLVGRDQYLLQHGYRVHGQEVVPQ